MHEFLEVTHKLLSDKVEPPMGIILSSEGNLRQMRILFPIFSERQED